MESTVLDSRASASTIHNATITVVIAAGHGRVCSSGSGYSCDSSSGSCRGAGAGAGARTRTCGSHGMRKIGGRITDRTCQVVAGFGKSTGERDVVVAVAAGVYYALDVAHIAGLGCDVSGKFLRIANMD